MPRVRFTAHLYRFFPDLGEEEEVNGATVADIVASLDRRHPGLAGYVLDDRGALRQHVNIFVQDRMVHDRVRLKDEVGAIRAGRLVDSISRRGTPDPPPPSRRRGHPADCERA